MARILALPWSPGLQEKPTFRFGRAFQTIAILGSDFLWIFIYLGTLAPMVLKHTVWGTLLSFEDLLKSKSAVLPWGALYLSHDNLGSCNRALSG